MRRGATAILFDYNGDFVRFCEKTVKVFEDKSQEHSTGSYKRILYQRYIDERERTSDVQRDLDRTPPLMDMIVSMMKQ